jgi:TolB-like protein/tetratricopeptide (TPR) repeat protein
LCDALRTAGLEAWFDQSELRSGDAWDASIRKQIRECALFVPVISASTQAREEGYFRLEWKLAVDRTYLMADDKAFLFPVVIDQTPERLARVPDRFRERQWTQLNDEADMAAFAARLARLLSRDPAAETGSPQHAAPGAMQPATASESPSHDQAGFRVGVSTFKYHGDDPDLAMLAQGMAEDIVTGLSRFSYLLVVRDTHAGGKAPNARYRMEGSLRRAGTRLRVAVQLVDTTTGAHLWAESYDRTFSPDSVFDLQDELVPRVVSTVADMNGILPASLNKSVLHRQPEELNPYEAVLRSFTYFWRLTAEEFQAARSGLEMALQSEPAYADAWAMLALLLVQAHGQRFDPGVDFLSEGGRAARRAVELAPTSHMGYFGLAQALFFRREIESFRNAATRTAELNPMDGNAFAFLGEMLSYSGELQQGKEFALRAKQLNPNHPGWYWITDYFHAYRGSDYRAALSCALKFNLPGHWGSKLMLCAAYAQLGELDAAGGTLKELVLMRPNLARTVRDDLEHWYDPEYVTHLIDGLNKAGLER